MRISGLEDSQLSFLHNQTNETIFTTTKHNLTVLNTSSMIDKTVLPHNDVVLPHTDAALARNVGVLPAARTGAGPPSTAMYYVALAGIFVLLLLLLVYCLHFVLSKIIELSKIDSLTDPIIQSKSSNSSRQQSVSVVKESAGAMALLCRHRSVTAGVTDVTVTDEEPVTETLSTDTTFSSQLHSTTHSAKSNTHSPRSNTHYDKSNTHSDKSNTHSTKSNTHSTRSNTHSDKSNTHSDKSNTHSANDTKHSTDSTNSTLRFALQNS